MNTVCSCPRVKGPWVIVPGKSVLGKEVSICWKKGDEICVPDWVGQPGRPKLIPSSIETYDDLYPQRGEFAVAVTALGLDPILIKPSSETVELSRAVALVITDGVFDQEGSTPSVKEFSFLLEYKLSAICNQGGTLLRVMAEESSQEVVLVILACQVFGAGITPELIRIVARGDGDEAFRHLLDLPGGYRNSDDVLRIGWGKDGHVPIVQHMRLQPHANTPAEFHLFWKCFGLSVFANMSFKAVMSVRQKEFKAAFEGDELSLALDYLAQYHSVVKSRRGTPSLMINGVPKERACVAVSDVALLFERYGQHLVERLLTDWRTCDGSQLVVVYPTKLRLSDDGKKWNVLKGSFPSLSASDSCMLALDSQSDHVEEFCKMLVRIDIPDGAKELFSFEKGDKLCGIITSGSGKGVVGENEVLLSPSNDGTSPNDQGLMVVLLVEKRTAKGTIRAYSCCVGRQAEAFVPGIFRKFRNQGLKLSISTHPRIWPQVVAGTDNKGKPYACQIYPDDASSSSSAHDLAP